LTASGWFRLIRQFPDPDRLSGFDLAVGTLDGRLARTVSIKFGPIAPSAVYRGALPVAAGPFGDVVLFAYWDGSKSELHSVSVTTGEDVVLAQRDDIIHAVTLDTRTDSVFLLTLDPISKAERGIFRIARGQPGSGGLFLQPEKLVVPKATDQVWKRLWVTPDGQTLVLVDCPSDCLMSAYATDGTTRASRQAIRAGQDIAGVSNDSVIAVFGCGPPCPATSYDFATGGDHPVGTFCEAGFVVSISGQAALVSDRAVDGKCGTTSYRLGRTDLATGTDAAVLSLPTRDRTLVTMDELQGAAPPVGWFLVGPAGQLVGFGAQQQVSPWLVRATDGATLHLPLLGPSRG
jgi:hypothetical protein